MTGVTVTRDSEWDEDQIALLLAAREQRAEIGPHGQPMDEAMNPLADPWRPQPGGWRYVPRVRTDFAARAIAGAQGERQKKYPEADLSADVWTVDKVWLD